MSYSYELCKYSIKTYFFPAANEVQTEVKSRAECSSHVLLSVAASFMRVRALSPCLQTNACVMCVCGHRSCVGNLGNSYSSPDLPTVPDFNGLSCSVLQLYSLAQIVC